MKEKFYDCEECELNEKSEGLNVYQFSEPYEIEDENVEKIPEEQKKMDFHENIPTVLKKENLKNLIQSGNCEFCNQEHFKCQCGEVYSVKDTNEKGYIEKCECGIEYHIFDVHEKKDEFTTVINIAKK